jgi:transcriptional regulator with XRE-family HTH domain
MNAHSPMSLPATPIVSREAASGLFQKIVRDAVINNGLITVEELADQSGVSEHTIRAWMRLEKAPSVPELDKALSVLCVLGSRDLNKVLSLIGYGGAVALDEPEPFKVCEVVPAAMPHFATVVQIAADGRVTNCEQPRWEEAHNMLVDVFLSHSSVARVG